MTKEVVTQSPAAPNKGASDLLARLYREIGISAVAAALQMSVQKPEKPARPDPASLPAILRDEDIAA
jgi:hypothetical protein